MERIRLREKKPFTYDTERRRRCMLKRITNVPADPAFTRLMQNIHLAYRFERREFESLTKYLVKKGKAHRVK